MLFKTNIHKSDNEKTTYIHLSYRPILLFQDHKDASRVAAKTIAQKAHDLSFDPDYLSPFAISAIDAGIEIRGMV